MRILILTGIYPPQIGGPAMYAKHLADNLSNLGYKIQIKTFGIERYFPTGVRHLYFFLKIIPAFVWAEKVIILDTFSVALPGVCLSKIMRRKTILRTGGDFLWEQYVERTGKKVLLSDFYKTEIENFSFKERKIFSLIKFVFKNVSVIVFSTDWQKDIFLEPYNLNQDKIEIIENCYTPHEESFVQDDFKKVFVGGTRNLIWKNQEILKSAFEKTKRDFPEIALDLEIVGHGTFLRKIKNSYAVILVSLGDISPNMILEAIRFNKPFILTKENGLNNRIKDIAILVDPLNLDDIVEKITWLLEDENYRDQETKIREFHFTHTYRQIAEEFENLFKKI